MTAFTEYAIEIFSLEELKQFGFSSFCDFTHSMYSPPKLISGEVR